MPDSGPDSGPDSSKVSAFLEQVDKTRSVSVPRAQGRLIFALDATLSRQPTWDMATQLQAEMFKAAASIGDIEIQIAFFRGLGEFRKSDWSTSGSDLARRMSKVECRGGLTQIGRVLRHAVNTARDGRLNALVFVGDAMEEDPDELCDLAGQLAVLNTPLFIFQEGEDLQVRGVFKEMARLSGGAYAYFNEGSAEDLFRLLKAVAIYAAGGGAALKRLSESGDDAAHKLLTQLPKGSR
ncbi:MAG: hypothetical protein PVF65_06270 [Sphingomonadales bacterium]